MKLAAPILLLIVSLARPALAYRPFDGTDGDVAETGDFEIEAGPVGYLQTGALKELELPNLTLNYGYHHGWELVLEGINHLALSAPDGVPHERITDTGLFTKHVLREGVLQGGTGLSIATEFGFLLPTYRDGIGFLGLWGALIASYRWRNFAVHLNGAFEVTPAWEPGGVGNLIIEGPDRWTVRPVAEGLIEEVDGGAYTYSGLIGAIWRISEALTIDAAFRAGTSDAGDIREVRLGFSLAIPVVPRQQEEGRPETKD